MNKVEVITGTAVPLDRSDIDTDQIIPAVWMKRIERTGYENGLFEKLRRDPDFILNKPERKDATILISGPNFGCGSSREHAPWALRDYGFKAVIAPSFGDIFRSNLPNVGLVPVVLDHELCTQLISATTNDSNAVVTIDLAQQTVTCVKAGIVSAPFFIESGPAYRLLNGLDLIDFALQYETQITHHEQARPWWMPKTNGTVEASFESWLEEETTGLTKDP